MKSTVATSYVVSQLQSELLTIPRARLLIGYLEKEVSSPIIFAISAQHWPVLQQRVRFSPDDILAGKKLLIEKGQKEKAELLERLKKRSQVSFTFA